MTRLRLLLLSILCLLLLPFAVISEGASSRIADIRASLDMAAVELDWPGAIQSASLGPDVTLYMVRNTAGLIAITEYGSDAAAITAFEAAAKGETSTFQGMTSYSSEKGGSLSWLSKRFVFSVASGAGKAEDLAEVLYGAAAENLFDAPVSPAKSDKPEPDPTGTKATLMSKEVSQKAESTGAVHESIEALADPLPATPIVAVISGAAEIVSDSSWRVTADIQEDQSWMAPAFDDSTWRPAMRPWPSQPAPASSIQGMKDTTADWVWHPDDPDLIYFRRVVDLQFRPGGAQIRITADNEYQLFVNGTLVGLDAGNAITVWNTAETYDIRPYLQSGFNVISVIAGDRGGGSGLLLDVRFSEADQDQEPDRDSDQEIVESTEKKSLQNILVAGVVDETPPTGTELLALGQQEYQRAWSYGDTEQRDAALSQAMTYFQQAQAFGIAEAIYMVGFMYETGAGVTGDNEIAMSHYEEAALAGYAPAYRQLILVQNQLGRQDEAALTFFRYWKAFPADADKGFEDFAYSPDTLRAIQKALESEGYYHRAIDGITEPSLKTAIDRFVREKIPDVVIVPDDAQKTSVIPAPATPSTSPAAPPPNSLSYLIPARGTAERKAILIAARAPITKVLGQPLTFVVEVVRTDGVWAYVQAVPHQPTGAPINWNATPFGPAIKDDLMSDTVMVLLKSYDRRWQVMDYVIGPTDAYWYGWLERFGLSEALFQN